jgi:uncharacterized protein DUF6924
VSRRTAAVVALLAAGAVVFAVVSRPAPPPPRTESVSVLAGASPAPTPSEVVVTPTTSPPPTTSPEGAMSPLVLRLDPGHDAEWVAVRAAMAAPVFEGTGSVEPWYANLTYVDEPSWYGLGPSQVLARFDERYRHPFVVLVDRAALTSPEHPVLVVATSPDIRGQAFRALPTTLQSIENNLSIANMDFHEFAESVDAHGVFRGF